MEDGREQAGFFESFREIPLYRGQIDFIKDSISIFNDKKTRVGALESPTGTGKTFSSLISAFYFLNNSSAFENLQGISFENVSLLREMYGISEKKVIYACRTHEQLEHVMKELKKLNKITKKNVSGVVLGSRRTTCINQKIRKSFLGDAIDSGCKIAVKDGKCPYYRGLEHKSKGKEALELTIEEAVKGGAACSFCPYFYLKNEAPKRQIVCMPYALLLRKNVFKEFGINEKDALVIVDEGHNLYDAVLEEHSVQLRPDEIEEAAKKVQEHVQKQDQKNRVQYLEVYILLEKLLEYLSRKGEGGDAHSESSETEKIVEVNRFLFESDILDMDLCGISEIIEKSRMGAVVSPLTEKNVENKVEKALLKLSKLCVLIAECDKTSYFVVKSGSLSFRSVFPSKYLSHLEKAKKILVVGGTLFPSSELQLLFNEEISCRSYPAVCSNVMVRICTEYRFTYARREKEIERAWKLVKMHYVQSESGGVLVFVQSKEALLLLKKEIRLDKEKEIENNVHFEGEATLNEYKEAIGRMKKAVLCCVMGGTFSEGVDFSDELCRVLVVCGLPLPKPTEECKYVEKHRGNAFYLERSMRTVNQTIGRAVRKPTDYSYVVLLDARFEMHRRKLSRWTKQHTSVCTGEETLEESKEALARWRSSC